MIVYMCDNKQYKYILVILFNNNGNQLFFV